MCTFSQLRRAYRGIPPLRRCRCLRDELPYLKDALLEIVYDAVSDSDGAAIKPSTPLAGRRWRRSNRTGFNKLAWTEQETPDAERPQDNGVGNQPFHAAEAQAVHTLADERHQGGKW